MNGKLYVDYLKKQCCLIEWHGGKAKKLRGIKRGEMRKFQEIGKDDLQMIWTMADNLS